MTDHKLTFTFMINNDIRIECGPTHMNNINLYIDNNVYMPESIMFNDWSVIDTCVIQMMTTGMIS